MAAISAVEANNLADAAAAINTVLEGIYQSIIERAQAGFYDTIYTRPENVDQANIIKTNLETQGFAITVYDAENNVIKVDWSDEAITP